MTIDRRDFFKGGLFFGGAALAGSMASAQAIAGQAASPAAFRTFEVTTFLDLSKQDENLELWLPLFQSDASHQRSLDAEWTSSGNVRMMHDPEYGAPMLHASWDETARSRTLEVRQRVATWERGQMPQRALDHAEREFWTRPSAGIPTDGIVELTARKIAGDIRDPKAKLRALYDWVVANSWRDPEVQGCGTGDIAAMLNSGNLGGKCADINSLLVGLARACELPARDVYGLRIGPSRQFASLGTKGAATSAQHCRAEVYLEGEGWFAVDPADVRKVVLEEKLPVDSQPVKDLADRLFGNWESNWASYNSADGIVLPGSPRDPQFHFLMYPTAMCADMQSNCLDAANFSYRIESREIIA